MIVKAIMDILEYVENKRNFELDETDYIETPIWYESRFRGRVRIFNKKNGKRTFTIKITYPMDIIRK